MSSTSFGFPLGIIIGGVVVPPQYGPKKNVPITAVAPPTLLMSGILARFGGPTGRSSGLHRRSGSTLHLQLLTLSTLSVSGPLMVVAIEHLLPSRVVPYWWGLGYQPHPRIPLVNCFLPRMRYVLQGWIKQCFPLKLTCLPPRV